LSESAQQLLHYTKSNAIRHPKSALLMQSAANYHKTSSSTTAEKACNTMMLTLAWMMCTVHRH